MDSADLRRQFAAARLVHRVNIRTERLFDELFPIFRPIEVDVGLGEDVVGSDTQPEQFPQNGRAISPTRAAAVDAFHQFVISGHALADVCGHGRHTTVYRSQTNKSTEGMNSLQTTGRREAAPSYNTLDAIVRTSRSESFLGKRTGDVPGARLGLARSATITMRTEERRDHKDSGSTGSKPTAGVGVAA